MLQLTVEEAIAKTQTFTPEDSYSKYTDLHFYAKNGDNYLHNIKLDQRWKFNDWSLEQFCRTVHPKLSSQVVKIIPTDTRQSAVNELIGKNLTDKSFLIRSKKDSNEMIAFLSDKYRPINHSDLANAIQDLGNISYDGKIYAAMSYDYFYLRSPIVKISDRDKGIFTGVQVSNGQTGKHAITINSMLYEMICSNGLVRAINDGQFLYSRHVGNVQFNFERFREWMNNQTHFWQKYYDLLHNVNIVNAKETILEKLPKESKIITKKLCEEIWDYLNKTYNTIEIADIVSGWKFVSAGTRMSQNYEIERRIEIDTELFKVTEKLL